MPVYGPAGDVDARPAHLFRCGDLFAVSLDPTGSNIPLNGCYEQWEHVSEFELGVRESLTDGASYRGLEGEKIYGCFGVVGAGVTGAGDGAGTDSLGWVCVVRVVVGPWSMFL